MMSADMAMRLAEHACLEWPIVVGPPELVMHRENTVFRVETRLGLHALRMHRMNYHSEDAIKSELAWMSMLSAAGFTVPQPAMSKDQTQLVAIAGHDETRFFSMLSWLPGEPFGKSRAPLNHVGSKRLDLMYAIGSTMARMHMLSDAWTPPAFFSRPRWDSQGLIGESPVWGRFWESKLVSEEERVLLNTLRKRCELELVQYESQGGDFGLIHADLVRENILIHAGSPTFIDFDDSGFGFRMFDIATVMIKNLREPDYEDMAAMLLNGYQSIRPLKSSDIAALPLMLIFRSLTYLGWADERSSEPSMAEKSARFMDDVKSLATHNLDGPA